VFADRLAASIQSGDFESLATAYAPEATLTASVTGGRTQARGRQEIAALLASWWPGPGYLLDWAADRHEHGWAISLERGGDEGISRQRLYVHLDADDLATAHYAYSAKPRAAGDGASVVPGAAAFASVGEVTSVTALSFAGNSGSPVLRLALEDGGSLVAKRVVPLGDWIMRATGDEGREAGLWLSGAFERLPAEIDPAIVSAQPDGDGWWLVMRDVSATLLPEGTVIPREDNRRILDAAAALHDRYWGEHVDAVGSLGERLGFLFPSTAEREAGGSDLIPKQLAVGWELFSEAADSDVAEAVAAIHADPAPYVSALEECGTTLIHGDLRDENLGLTGDGIVLIDWALSAHGPPSVELAWYMLHDSWRIDATNDEIVDDFRRAEGDRSDERALDLGLISGLATYGWLLGHSAIAHTSDQERSWARDELSWWVPRVREAIERSWS
jgi:Phosphotransferase enzyme family